MEEQPTPQKKTIRKYRWLRRIARVMLGILIFLILLVLFVRSPWGQHIIVQQAVRYVEGKTGTEVQIEKAFVTFDGNVVLDGVYLEDKKGDTLVYSKHLEANVPLMPLINGTGFTLENATWDGLTARVYRDNLKDGFNYQFLIDAFVVEDTTTTAEPLQLKIGTVDLTKFDITFKDKVEELDALVKFDEFHLTMKTLDLDKMIVDIDDVSLKNAIIKYDKDTVTAVAKSTPDANPNVDTTISEVITDDANDSPLPKITVGNLRLDKVKLNYESVIDGIALETDLHYFETAITKADVGASNYQVSFLNLKDSEVFVKMKTATDQPAVSTTDTSTAFTWPDFTIQVKDVNLSNNLIDYRVDGAVPQDGVFNANAIAINNLDLQSSLINYENKSAQVNIEQVQFAEAGGLGLKRLDFKLNVDDTNLVITDLNTQVNKNKLQGDVAISYGSMDAFIKAPDQSSINASIPRYELYLEELYRFQPDLRNNEYVRALARKPLTGSLKANGGLNKVNIPNFVMNWGPETAIVAKGTVSNPTDVDKLTFDFPNLKMRSVRNDILRFVKEEDLGATLPQRVSLNADIAGSTTRATADATLTTTDGIVKVDGSFNNGKIMSFDAIASAQNVKLSKLLQMPELGDLTMTMDARGSGSELSNLDANIDATINSFAYNGYPIKDVPVKGSFKNGNGTITSSYRDDNLEASLKSDIQLENDMANATATIDIDGIDLRAFKVTSRNIRAGALITGSFKGDATNYEVSSKIANGIAVYDNQSYLLGDVNVHAFVRPDTTSVDVRNKMLNLNLRSNTDPQRLFTAMTRHIDRYLTTDVPTDSIAPVVMNIKGSLAPAPILRAVILPGLQALDTLQLAVDFDERARKLDADINVPYLKYADSEIDSLRVRSRSDAKNLQFDLGFKRLTSGPLNVERTVFNGTIEQNQLNLDFTSYDDAEKLIHIASTLSRKRTNNGPENLEFRVLVDDLILNKESWTIPQNNVASYGDGKLAFNDFKIANGSQSITFDSKRPGNNKEHLGIIFNNFELQNVLSILNPDVKLATGSMNGELVLEDIFNKLGFTADLQIDDLQAMEVPLGKLTLDAQSAAGDQYLVDMKVNGDLLDLALDGSYTASVNDASLDMELALNKLELKALSDIAPEFFKDGKGTIAGNFTVSGTTVAPEYDGVLNFNNAGITPVMLDTPFTIENEKVVINNEGVTLDSFTIRDVNNNPIVASGFIGTEELLNPSFDLTVTAKDFTALNASEEDNELYYGKATFSADASIKGDLTLPVVNVDVTVDRDTDVYYVMPATELDVVQRDGIV
ncbi:MAG: translocation/assembly module TamB domain-containing protein, partial [Nonlabens sp.]|nr:translocation/assembly module TamB domain-containing protein [Nonlabens sp.]